MEKDNNNKFKLKFSRIFTNSCKTQDISQVIDHQKPIFTPQISFIEDEQQEHHPKQQQQPPFLSMSYPSLYYPTMMCKPRCPETFDQMVRENCIIPTTAGNSFPRRKIAGKYTPLSPSTVAGGGATGDFTASGRRCPPASPASPLHQKKNKKKQRKNNNGGSNNNNKNKKFDKTHFKNHPFSVSSSNETERGDWFSSDDEREDEEHETETLFSSAKSVSFSSKSISLSSDSESHYPARTRARPRNRRRRRRAGTGRAEAAMAAEVAAVPLEGKVKDTFAVVKSSSDPYNDFRTSMVEMIIEKQIFGAKELEQLLKCFLSLNSPHHHRVIVEVFTEIWDALFSYRS